MIQGEGRSFRAKSGSKTAATGSGTRNKIANRRIAGSSKIPQQSRNL
jgi:hypothetical protein